VLHPPLTPLAMRWMRMEERARLKCEGKIMAEDVKLNASKALPAFRWQRRP